MNTILISSFVVCLIHITFRINHVNGLFFDPGEIEKMVFKYDFVIIGAGSSAPEDDKFLSKGLVLNKEAFGGRDLFFCLDTETPIPALHLMIGSVLARRLSEKWTVLLLEAGNAFDEETYKKVKTPASFFSLLGSSVDWNFTTSKQSTACLGNDGGCQYPCGKALGGSSSINAMLYTRGYRYDYDKWVKSGVSGWAYDEISKYFDKQESNDGPISVEEFIFKTPLVDEYIKASEENGFKATHCSTYENNCVYKTKNTIKGPTRWSAYNAYLESYKSSNLTILTNAYATRVIIDAMIAKGVEYNVEGRTYIAWPKREVILSAGSINTPKILLLSGIGPKEELLKHGINIVANLPVGKNLQDHTRVGLFYRINSTYPITTDDILSNRSQYLYKNYGSGPLATSGIEVMAFYKTDKHSQEPPDIQIYFASYVPPTNPIPAIAATVIYLRPRSVGFVKLRDSNPYSDPIINPNFFQMTDDLLKTTQGMKKAHEIIFSKEMEKYSPELLDREHCDKSDNKNLEELFTCIAKVHTQSNYHPVGTVKMGNECDESSVVNSELQVKGIQRLRVADASIAPFLPSANTNSLALMIGEKASDIITKYHESHRIYNKF